MSVDLPVKPGVLAADTISCPYCDAQISTTALSCRCCARDLTPVLPLLRRLNDVEARLAAVEAREPAAVPALPAPLPETGASVDPSPAVATGRRDLWALALGFAGLLLAYAVVVIWLDLPLLWLRLASIVLPFATGAAYFGRRPRLTSLDVGVALAFAAVAVAAMNALLGWIDSIPAWPQGTAAWRETFFYALSIGASMICGMLLRVTQVALSARGLTSLPRLRDSVLAANGKVPMDTLKAIELTILLVSTIITAITGLVAGLLGVSR